LRTLWGKSLSAEQAVALARSSAAIEVPGEWKNTSYSDTVQPPSMRLPPGLVSTTFLWASNASGY
jgi:hypothetical protein